MEAHACIVPLLLGRVESEGLGDNCHEQFGYALATTAFIPWVTILDRWINKEATSQHSRDDHQLKADDRRQEKEGRPFQLLASINNSTDDCCISPRPTAVKHAHLKTCS